MSVEIKLHPVKQKTKFDITKLIKLPLFFGIRDEYDLLRPGETAEKSEELVIYNTLKLGRGIVFIDDGDDYYLILKTPAATSDLEIFMMLIQKITKKFNISEIYCDGEPYAIEALDKIEALAARNMKDNLKILSNPEIKDAEIFGALVPIAIDEIEQQDFKNNQAKFDIYLNDKQRLAQTAEMLPAVIAQTKHGNIWMLFILPHTKPLILPRVAKCRRKDLVIDHFVIVSDYGSMDYTEFLKKVDTSERFDAFRFIKVFSEKELQKIFNNATNYLDELKGSPIETKSIERRPNEETLKKERALEAPVRETGESLKNYFFRIGLNDKSIKLAKNYFSAFVNLYGIISFRKAFEIVMEQNPNMFTVEMLLGLVRNMNFHNTDYAACSLSEFYEDAGDTTPLDDELVHISFLEMSDYEDYYGTVAQQANKPYYVPERDELLKYADELYTCRSKECEALIDFLEKNARTINPKMSMREAVEDYIFGVHLQVEPNVEIDALLRFLEPPSSHKDAMSFLNKLLPFVTSAMNSTRLLVNRGYTPDELVNFNGGMVTSLGVD